MCVPIYWDQIEPEKGKVRLRQRGYPDNLSRKYEVKLILLWFAPLEDGVMDFAPG